jgi:hypothetical protein
MHTWPKLPGLPGTIVASQQHVRTTVTDSERHPTVALRVTFHPRCNQRGAHLPVSERIPTTFLAPPAEVNLQS